MEPGYLLGNIKENPMIVLVAFDKQRKFERDIMATPKFCLECEVLFACHGGCPKNRFINKPTGDRGLNYLCD